MREDINKEDVIDFCIKYGFDKYFIRLSESYDTILDERGQNISGGQKQLISLARVLYKKPKVIILDEPSAAMDEGTEAFLVNILLYLLKKK